MQALKASRAELVSSSPMAARGLIKLRLQIGHLHEKAGISVIPGLEIDGLRKTAFTSRYINKISPIAGTTSPDNLSTAAVAEEPEERPVMTAEKCKHREPIEAACASA